ncbi:hypothetical protein CAEBREN_17748 [Caenorhabditis brenneri]|uniref:Uncharacterized protein n=1 Tax=Caenorhabditis brenneri TaxID=135651 RepID=G0MMD1_CAEBE|nr:hypothetical protein CAEBREN_17748 [Caenorhabditis brenneri]
MTHVIFGLFGMIFSIWMLIGSFIAFHFEFYMITTTKVFISSFLLLFFSYLLFCSACTNLYIRLPPQNLSFVGIKPHVILLAFLHLPVMVVAFYLPMKIEEPSDGIIYKVAVRRTFENSKELLPGGFSFDDETCVDTKWLERDHVIVNNYWI